MDMEKEVSRLRIAIIELFHFRGGLACGFSYHIGDCPSLMEQDQG
jgi:hypothetical protein